MIITICNVYKFTDREIQLLPHFIKHYRDKLDTEIIFCCDENNKDLQNYCLNNKIKYHTYNFEFNKVYGIVDSNRINKVKNIYKCWYIPTDLDEFISFESKDHLLKLMNSCLDNNFNYITGHFCDRFVSKNKILEKISLDIEISEQFPHVEFFTKNVMKACDKKVCLLSPDLDVDVGHHYAKPNSAAVNKNFDLCVNHYKWFGNILNLEQEKLQIRLKNKSYYGEQQRLLNYFSNL